jgi:hypothetical protein
MARCRKPYITSEQIPAPCGQCTECLINRKRLWTHRIILESKAHDDNCFVTLTYDDDHLPTNTDGIPSINKEHLRLFIHKLRRRAPNKFRYYAVSEYGTAGARGINPHFHLCIFGLGEEHQELIAKSWTEPTKHGKQGAPMGFTYTGSLTHASAAYVAGYIQKKSKYNKDMYEELNITPEYSVMSNRPAIGLKAIPLLAEAIEKYPEALTEYGDVPFSLVHGGKSYPLGTYLRNKLREALQLDHDEETVFCEITGEVDEKRSKKIWHAKERHKDVYKEQLRLMQENTQEDQKLPKDAKASLKHLMEYIDKQHHINIDKKQSMNQTRYTH